MLYIYMYVCMYVVMSIAFNKLRKLKIVLCLFKMSFKISSLRCVKYIEKKPT